MKIGVSPGLAEAFPDLPVVEHIYDMPFDVTLCLSAEAEDTWLKRRHRMLRPFFCSDVNSAREVFNSLHPKPTKKKRPSRKK